MGETPMDETPMGETPWARRQWMRHQWARHRYFSIIKAPATSERDVERLLDVFFVKGDPGGKI